MLQEKYDNFWKEVFEREEPAIYHHYEMRAR
jgi:hypothetical protein